MTTNQTEIEVRYAETDQMGVVYHANYLVWFEIGRTKFIEQLGFQYAEMEKDQIISPVIDVQISYRSPARYGDKVAIYTWLEHYDRIRTTYGYRILGANDEVLVTGNTVHVIVDAETFRPLRLKHAYPAWHKAYEEEIKGAE